jgi:hypothetical protein
VKESSSLRAEKTFSSGLLAGVTKNGKGTFIEKTKKENFAPTPPFSKRLK